MKSPSPIRSILVREVFRCRVGNCVEELVEAFRRTLKPYERVPGFGEGGPGVTRNSSGSTLVLELRLDDYDALERQLELISRCPMLTGALEGYVEVTWEGHREVHRFV
jgi:hypothetical protein